MRLDSGALRHQNLILGHAARGVSQRELAKRLEVSRWTIQQVDG